MPKAYWVSTYQGIDDNDKMAAYGKLALPAIEAAGGRFIARAVPAAAFELGVKQRTVLIEFDSLEAALAAHETPAYKAALAALEGGVRRDLRIVEGL
ncbi:DUF1330 domain-containing protein [Ramlibacter sp.]|uniref:DUF1330 domain-containing protein n=1 Tax=Ramlibacter sp. TaxID=1917967 RepID=UPI003D0C9E91